MTEMTENKTTAPKDFTKRVAELRALGMSPMLAHNMAILEDRLARDAAWRAANPE